MTHDKIEVAEALHRFAAGIDLRDADLLASAFAEDAVSDFRPAAAKGGFDYPVLTGRDVIVSALLESLSPLVTSHSTSNHRIEVFGDTARLDALVEAQHLPRDDPSRHYMMKNRYDVTLIREGERWRIARMVIDNIWRSGDPEVLAAV